MFSHVCVVFEDTIGQSKVYLFFEYVLGMFAGIALLINNITGPGVPSLPNMFAESGWLTPTVMLLVIWALSSVSASMYCEAMRRIPGNEHFRGRLEYTSIVRAMQS